MIPGPRPSKGLDSPSTGRDRGSETSPSQNGHGPNSAPEAATTAVPAPVAVTRTARGWTVVSPAGAEHAADLVEGLSLADLVAEEFGVLTEPDRTARRSARGATEIPRDGAPLDARVAALERTVAQLEHALAARVSTERAIGVLAERQGISARAAFESLRRDARSHGRPVSELAREVLDGLSADDIPAPGSAAAAPDDDRPAAAPGRSVAAPAGRRPGAVCVPVVPLEAHVHTTSAVTAPGGGRS